MHTYVISYDCFEGCGDTEIDAKSRADVEDECRNILRELGEGCADVFNADGSELLFCVEE